MPTWLLAVISVDPIVQQNFLSYLRSDNVLVVVMAPSFRSTGPPSGLNSRIETWRTRKELSLIHI
eukprot:3689475-Pyramimonas_sp.AAC.1